MYVWPVARKPRIRRDAISNTYGMVRHYADGRPKPHQGADAEAPVGTPIVAVADGRVVGIRSAGDYGIQLLLELSVPTPTGAKYAFYAHLSKTSVAAGDVVKQGHVLGATGDTGNAAGMAPEDQHLHFEARTEPWPGTGLAGRMSPFAAFGWKFSPSTGAVTLG